MVKRSGFLFSAILVFMFLLGGCSSGDSTSQTKEPSSTPYPPAITSLPANCPKYDAGEYEIGKDIPAGEYVLIPIEVSTARVIISDNDHKKMLYMEDFRGHSIVNLSENKFVFLKDCYAIPYEHAPNFLENKTLFGDGTYKVGVHIPAGRYSLKSNSHGNEQSRYAIYENSSKSTVLHSDKIYLNEDISLSDGQYLVLSYCTLDLTAPTPTLAPTFTPTPKPSPTPTPKPSPKLYKSGQYKVGIDIPAGEYLLLPESSRISGYFCVTSDSNGDDILYNDNFDGNSIISISDSEYLELSLCYAIPFWDAPNFYEGESSLTDGMYRVGYHIPAGEYKVTATSDSGYYCIYGDSRHDKIISNNNFSGSRYVTIRDGQFLKLDRCIITINP